MRLITKLRRAPARSSLSLPVGASSPSITGRVMGVFTLPVAAEWGHRTLPAGGYVFVVASAPARSWVYVRGQDEATVFFPASIGMGAGASRSELGLSYDGRRYHVRSLALREAGTVLHFDGPGREAAPPETPGPRGVFYVLLRPFVEGRRSDVPVF